MNWFLIGASVGSLVLGLYLDIRGDASPRVRRVGWSIFVLVVLMTAIGTWLDVKAPRLHLGLLGPQLSASEGYEYAIGHAPDRDELKLLEALGSYYTCVRKPDSIFLQFCEWVFVFRNERSNELVEYRVLDTRMPELPVLPQGIVSDTPDGGFTTYVTYNVPPKALGMRGAGDGDAAVRTYDAQGRVIVTSMGEGPTYSFEEVTEGPNEFVLSLTRTCGRPTDHLTESTVMERWNRFGDVVIYRANHERSEFYDNLRPIELALDAQEAVTKAMEAGAEFEVPGKQMISASPVRLHDGQDLYVSGPCWRLPLRLSLRPLVVQAQSHRVYFVNDDGKYTAYWSTEQYLPELAAGILFLVLLAIALHVFRRTRQGRRRRSVAEEAA